MKETEAFPSNWMKAGDFPTPETLTISSVSTETVGQGDDQEDKRVVSFRESDKDLILNKTNWKAIKKISGIDDDEQWAGVEIEVFKTVVEFKGDHVDAIRIRPPGGWDKWTGPAKKGEKKGADDDDEDSGLPF